MQKVKRINVKGFSVRYAVFGSGKKPLVILPGISVDYVTNSAAAVENRYKVFLKDYTVYLLDRRDNIPENYTMYDMASDTAEAIKALGLSKCFFFGASQGGMLVLYLAVYFPELVKCAVIGSSSATLTDGFLQALEKWIDYAQKGDRVNLSLSFAQYVYSKDLFEKFRDFFVETGKKYSDENLARFLGLARAFYSLDIEKDLGKIKCPLLAIGAEGDAMFKDYSSKLIAEKTGGEVYIYGENYGHGVYDEAPDYPQRIFNFLQR